MNKIQVYSPLLQSVRMGFFPPHVPGGMSVLAQSMEILLFFCFQSHPFLQEISENVQEMRENVKIPGYLHFSNNKTISIAALSQNV